MFSLKMIKNYYRLFHHIERTQRFLLIKVLVLMIFAVFAELLTIGSVIPVITFLSDPDKILRFQFSREMLGFLNFKTPSDARLMVVLCFIVLVTVGVVIRTLLLVYSTKAAAKIGYILGVKVYKSVIYQQYSFFLEHSTSEVISAIEKVQTLTRNTISPLLQGFIASITIFAITSLIAFIEYTVVLFATVGVGAMYLIITYFVRAKLNQNGKILAIGQTSRIKNIQESLGSIRDLILRSSQKDYVEGFSEVEFQISEKLASNNIISNLPKIIVELFGIITILLIAYTLAIRNGGLAESLPMLGAIAFGAQRLFPLLQQVYLAWSKVVSNRYILVDVLQLLELESKERDLGKHNKINFNTSVTLKNVSFKYAGSTHHALEKVNFSIKKGTKLGIIGPTGCGKTTMVDILMGLLQPTKGQLLVDNHPINDLNLSSWQSKISHVPQSIYLSDTSIEHNIAFGSLGEDINREKLIGAAKSAQIHDFIESLSNKYKTNVGERGVKLSGGQKQRLGIARALYHDAEILVLDEATSALDTLTEGFVVKSLNNLDKKLTVITIAHRLESLKGYDLILQIKRGKITRYEKI